MKFNDIKTPAPQMNVSFEAYFERLAAEAAVSDNVVGFFTETVPGLMVTIQSKLSRLAGFDHVSDLKDLSKNLQATEVNKLDRQYLTYRDMTVTIPEGFTGEFVPYVLILTKIANEIYSKTLRLIGDYRYILGSAISNKQALTTLKDMTSQYKQVETARLEVEDALKGFFDDRIQSRARLIDVLPSYRDVQALVPAIKNLKNQLEPKQIERIQKEASEVIEMVGMIKDQLDKGEIKDVSPAFVKNLSIGAHELAQYLDTSAVFHYHALSIITASEEVMKKLKVLL